MAVLRELHDGSLGGHFGTKKTFFKTEPRFYWPHQAVDVDEYVKSCRTCEQVKPPLRYNRAPLKPLVTSRPFQLVTTDLMGPFPETPRGSKHILVFMDHFTKWAEVFAVPDQTAVTVARCLKSLIMRHGVPEALLSDQGKAYESDLLKEVLDILDVHKLRTTAYHPQCDGQSERFNRTMIAMLRSYVHDQDDDEWDMWLEELVFVYRTAVQSTTGQTPFEMVYGRRPRIQLDLVFPEEDESGPVEYADYVNELRERMEEMYEKVRAAQGMRMDKAKLW